MFRKASFAVALLVIAGSAAAQSDAASDLIAVRAETRQLERDMYELFNQLNSDDDFDVTCDEYKVTGSTIPEWQCNAAFMRNASMNASSSRFDNPGAPMANTQGGFIPTSGRELSFKNRRKVEQLNEEMMSLARQHPNLAAAMIAYNDKREQLAKLEQ